MAARSQWVWRSTDRLARVPRLPSDLPQGRVVDLPGRGHTYVVDTGADGARPTLVLLHALACTGLLTWYPSFDALRARYRLVIFDQRWHGQGIRSPRFDLDELADDVVALADVLGIDTFLTAGYSLGSLVGQLTAHRHPDRVSGLVLCASSTHFGRSERVQVGLHHVSARAAQAAVGAQIGALVAPSLDNSPQGRWAWRQFRATSAREIARATAVIAGFDSRPWIGDVQLPTAVVVTARDKLIPPVRQRALAARVAGATVYESPSGHASCVIGAERFTPALVAACASVSARVAAPAQPRPTR